MWWTRIPCDGVYVAVRTGCSVVIWIRSITASFDEQRLLPIEPAMGATAEPRLCGVAFRRRRFPAWTHNLVVICQSERFSLLEKIALSSVVEWKMTFMLTHYQLHFHHKTQVKSQNETIIKTHITAILMSSVGKLLWACNRHSAPAWWRHRSPSDSLWIHDRSYDCFPLLIRQYWLWRDDLTSISQPFWRVQWWALDIGGECSK